MNPIITEILKVGIQVMLSLAKQNSMTSAELDQLYLTEKQKFLNNDPNALPDR